MRVTVALKPKLLPTLGVGAALMGRCYLALRPNRVIGR